MVAAARGKRTTAKINGQAVEDEKTGITDSLIISDISGIKIMEISNDELTYQIKSGSITVSDDYLKR